MARRQAGSLENDNGTLAIRGDWTLADYKSLRQTIEAWPEQHTSSDNVDLQDLGRVDTAGASLLVNLLGPDTLSALVKDESTLPREQSALLHTVAQSMVEKPAEEPEQLAPVARFLTETGKKVEAIWHLSYLLAGFVGQVIATLFAILARPGRWRMTPFVAAIHNTGLNALPIVALLTFLVGAVVAFLGATVLKDFGATIYTVNLVAFSFLREFGVLLAAILLAGRTASAFTAQIGAMKVNEELDAIRTLGLDPVELLVIPRVLAMMVSLPILTFVGMLAGLIGGGLVCAVALDISPSQFMAIVERDIALKHFLVGISKAPVFAFLIAAIGCLEGFKVGGSAQSVGVHTTSSVVQSIFMVILLDAVAALFFMEMGW
ncbi:MlaE family lipid ABC transporter permease subunit [Marinobacter adhaerens]|uniref:MlaE family lipid ABC transporter permease subunit n=1 Tax=Marinobacter adhaerens TaxID=1033846 RepID=A0A851HP33_9GAMM|nr:MULTISPECIES: MlaE family lipid ABC transporter permease subunit [Marinobacter]NWN90657.1 MlaE family lipid ABC transporter permease subunit [Marinobacter adhaerens]